MKKVKKRFIFSIILLIMMPFLFGCGRGIVIRHKKTVGNIKIGTVNGEWQIIGLKDYNVDDIIIPDDIGYSKISKYAFSSDKIPSGKKYRNISLGTSVKEYSYLPQCTNFYYSDTLENYLKNDHNNSLLYMGYNIYFIDQDGEELFDNKKYTMLSEYLIIPSGVKRIPDYSFYHLQKKFKEIVFNDEIEEIGKNAFEKSIGKDGKINFGKDLKIIDEWAFWRCEFETLEFPTNLIEIKEMAFEDCVNLTSVTFNNNLEVIGTGAFSGCSRLKIEILPEGIKECIGGFSNRNSDYLVIPKNIKKMDVYLVMGKDETLEKKYVAYYKGTEEEFSKITLYKKENVKIANFVEADLVDKSNVCFYSETMPSSNPEKYWHYENGEIKKWQ